MEQTKMKELRVKNNFTQEQMADALHISQNAYSLIESGKTKLVDIERINIISEKLGASALELGLFDGLNITQHFNDKVETGYIGHIENLYSNKDFLQLFKDELHLKNKQIEEMAEQVRLLISKMK